MSEKEAFLSDFAGSLKYDAQGLIPAVIQDAQNNDVLMVAWMNREAVEKTLQGPFTHFYSRSRRKLWLKGETSGHTQTVKEVYLDCDRDSLLIKVDQKVAACHAGWRSCFFSRLEEGELKTVGEKVFSKKEVSSR